MTTDVLVVGAGPVGLMLAGELALQGVSVVVYDRLSGPSLESRGASFTKRTAECFEQRGLLKRLGKTEPADSHFGGIAIDVAMLDADHSGHRGVPQFRTESMLENWVAGLGVEIRRGHEVTGFVETPTGITATYEGRHGPGRTDATYLVGCDGGRSTIRKLAGVQFPGTTGSRGFLTADVVGIDTRKRRIGENLADGSMVMAMDLENGVTRVVVHEAGTAIPHQGALTFTDLADAWQRLTDESIHHGQCRWLSCFTDASRTAAEYRVGRVFLAGDATHVQPPAMALGLSVGVQDAVNLGWKLAAAVHGWAPEGLLDSYHYERHPIGEELARNARAAIELRLTGQQMSPVREVFRDLVAIKGAAEHIASMLSGLGIRYDVGPGDHPLLGRRLDPDLELTLSNGTTARIAELLHTARGLLITTNTAPEVARAFAHRVDTVTGTWTTPGTTPLDAALVRPDGYIAWTSPGTQENLEDALEQWFGPGLVPQPNAAPPLSPPPNDGVHRFATEALVGAERLGTVDAAT